MTAAPLIVVAAALVDASGRVLMQQRAAGKAHAGLWEFPGGKVESDETAVDALARELREELDIIVDVADLQPIDFAIDRRVILLLFACRRWRGTAIGLAADALQWDDPASLAILPMPPPDVALAERLADRLQHRPISRREPIRGTDE
ncbi:(deoxy)nucleoside triphosphate pyrophosphohydrolase [Sphingomonas sp.]|uniref:(deoxy)nucleoside triphosphate pyrophosphohydrolase n=1 Tax=Sphingomonas sp. TaxID=28214 RepID=UPI0035C8521B